MSGGWHSILIYPSSTQSWSDLSFCIVSLAYNWVMNKEFQWKPIYTDCWNEDVLGTWIIILYESAYAFPRNTSEHEVTGSEALWLGMVYLGQLPYKISLTGLGPFWRLNKSLLCVRRGWSGKYCAEHDGLRFGEDDWKFQRILFWFFVNCVPEIRSCELSLNPFCSLKNM